MVAPRCWQRRSAACAASELVARAASSVGVERRGGEPRGEFRQPRLGVEQALGQPFDEPFADGFERGRGDRGPDRSGRGSASSCLARAPARPRRAAVSAAGDRSTCRPAARHRCPAHPTPTSGARARRPLPTSSGALVRRLHSRVQQSRVLRHLDAVGAGRRPTPMRPLGPPGRARRPGRCSSTDVLGALSVNLHVSTPMPSTRTPGPGVNRPPGTRTLMVLSRAGRPRARDRLVRR